MSQVPFNPNPNVAAPIGPGTLPCDYCHRDIRPNEPCEELFSGKLGRSDKSGLPMVVVDERREPPLVFHTLCHLRYVMEESGFDPDELLEEMGLVR